MSPVLRKFKLNSRKFKLKSPIVLRLTAKRKARMKAEMKAEMKVKRRGYKPSPEAIL